MMHAMKQDKLSQVKCIWLEDSLAVLMRVEAYFEVLSA